MEGLLLADLQKGSGLSRDDGEALRQGTLLLRGKRQEDLRSPEAEAHSAPPRERNLTKKKKKKGEEKTSTKTQPPSPTVHLSIEVQGPKESNGSDYSYRMHGSTRKCRAREYRQQRGPQQALASQKHGSSRVNPAGSRGPRHLQVPSRVLSRAVPRASVCLAWLQPQGNQSRGEQ